MLTSMSAKNFIQLMVFAISMSLASASSAAAKPPIPLRVAYSSISGSAVVPFIALDKGFFAKSNLRTPDIPQESSENSTHLRGHGADQNLSGFRDS